MRILMTNVILAGGTGTETLVRDLAPALRRRGHTVICFAPQLGGLATRIRATGTPVVDSVTTLSEAPDVIHGHHAGPTMASLCRFAETPAVFVCHDWSSTHDDPPIHPRIRRYLYVRNVLRERLVAEKGISPDLVRFWGNTVDLVRIGQPRLPPARLRVAGIYAHPGSVPFLPTLAAACRASGISFQGELLAGGDHAEHPEKVLSGCDLVFASGRMAIEALAAGCAVINADRFGIGGLVTKVELDRFVAANFAIGALSEPAGESPVAALLDRYDAADAAAVSQRVRDECGVMAGAERIERIYNEAIADAAARPADRSAEGAAVAGLLEKHLQLGLLYGREGVRRRFTPEPEAELVAALDILGVASSELARTVNQLTRTAGDLTGTGGDLSRRLDELAGQTARLARLQPIGAVLELWRRWRRRRQG